MKTVRRVALVVLATAVAFACGCKYHSVKEVSDHLDLNLPYWQTAVAGFNRAAAVYDVTAKVAGPEISMPRPNSRNCKRR